MITTTDDRLTLLRHMIRLKGQEYVPSQPFMPLFNEEQSTSFLFKTGRQLGKTTSATIHHILQLATHKYFGILCVAPRATQSNRISLEFFRPILRESPIRNILKQENDSVSFYRFHNGSYINFSYAFLDEDRVRSITADKLHIDEIQDLNPKFLPTIISCIDASPWRQIVYTGTPKATNNLLHQLWLKSSQAEWIIKCDHCGKDNIPSLEHHIHDMLGSHRDDISMDKPATICAYCKKIIYPQKGRWVHAFPEQQWTMAGYHIPQIIIPWHYASPHKWQTLLYKREGGENFTPEAFTRDVLGEASGELERLLSLEDLLAVATLNNRKDIDFILKMLPNYPLRIMGIDWGGGGEAGNYTTLALAGYKEGGRIEIPWGIELLTPHDHFREAKEIRKYIDLFKPHYIVHDYSGAGSLRETILVHSGVPADQILPCEYVNFHDVAIKFVPASETHPRNRYHISPSRCLLFVIGAIKKKMIHFFKDDYKDEFSGGLLRHWLSLCVDEAKLEHNRYIITHDPGSKDEFAQASMLACIGIWSQTRWPKFVV